MAKFLIFIDSIQPLKYNIMKKFLGIPALLLMGLISCNSGTGSETSGTDSTGMSTDTSSMNPDTAHSTMTTTTIDALPAIPAGAKVSFKNLKDGQTVSSPLKVEMSATNISIDSAGTIKPNSGHFHLIIDDGDSTATGIVIPKDITHIHLAMPRKKQRFLYRLVNTN